MNKLSSVNLASREAKNFSTKITLTTYSDWVTVTYGSVGYQMLHN